MSSRTERLPLDLDVEAAGEGAAMTTEAALQFFTCVVFCFHAADFRLSSAELYESNLRLLRLFAG